MDVDDLRWRRRLLLDKHWVYGRSGHPLVEQVQAHQKDRNPDNEDGGSEAEDYQKESDDDSPDFHLPLFAREADSI